MLSPKSLSIVLKKRGPSQQEGLSETINFQEKAPRIEEILDAEDFISVFDDAYYDLILDLSGLEKTPDQVTLFLGKEDQAVEAWRNLSLRTENNNLQLLSRRFFADSVGLVFFKLKIKCVDEDPLTFYSPLLSVFLAEQENSSNLQSICKKVIENEDILFDKNISLLSSALRQKERESALGIFDQYLATLNSIARVYSRNAPYFSSSCQGKLTVKEEVSSFEKLSNVHAKTLTYIAQHPEELNSCPESTGISYGTSYFVPRRTLIFRNQVDKDIYENRVTLGFLELVLKKTNESIEKLNQLFDNLPSLISQREGYINSSALLINQLQGILQDLNSRLMISLREIKVIYHQYSRFLPISKERFSRVPRPTAIFLTVPQYRQVYDVISTWFSDTFEFQVPEFFSYEINRCSRIYEQYILVRLHELLTELGWSLKTKGRIDWGLQVSDNSEDPSALLVSNNFVYQNKDSTLQVFYEPFISNVPSENDLVGLIRNSSGSLTEDGKITTQTKGKVFYTPDFVLKLQSEGTTKYLLLDAKFSKKNEVIEKSLVPLIFKYILGLTPQDSSSEIHGLHLLCGKLDKKEKLSTSPLWDHSEGLVPIFNKNRIKAFSVHESEDSPELKRSLSVFLNFETQTPPKS